MKNLSLLFAVCLFTIQAHAQFEFGISSGIGFNSRFTKQVLFDDFSNQIYKFDIKNNHIKTSNYHSINLIYSINKKFSLESGIEYLNRGYRIKDLDVIYRFQIDSNTSQTYGSTFNIYHQYRSLAIPLMLNYHIGTKKLNYFVAAGASFQSILDYKIRYNSSTESASRTNTVKVQDKRFNLAPMLRLGMRYNLKENLYLRFSADFRHDVFSNAADVNVYKSYYKDFNTSIGIFYKFK